MYTVSLYERAVKDPSLTELLVHDDGVLTPELDAIYRERRAHDPADINAARQLADDTDRIRLGVFFRDERRPCYDEIRRPTKITASERIALLDKELDRYAV
jgi:hypothetical protein